MRQDLLSTGQAAKLLAVSAERVRQLVREGRLAPTARLDSGQVFEREAVLALAEERATRAATASR